MKHVLPAIIALFLAAFPSASLAQGFRMEVGYFDFDTGPLTVDLGRNVPLPDGCLGQVIVDTASHGITPPLANGLPASGSRLLSENESGFQTESSGTFLVNGLQRLHLPGCFLVDVAASMSPPPCSAIWIRVWNARDLCTASGYWDSPLYQVLEGEQQVSFTRAEWLFHEFKPQIEDLVNKEQNAAQSAPRVVPVSVAVLQTCPNPFNSSARIRLTLNQPEHVTLSLFDIQGRLVATVMSRTLAEGRHDLTFEGRALPSGLYLLSLYESGRLTAVERLLLVR
jgi:hypothetical protein